ncbi:MAG: hypothetical protein WC231_01325 [Dehalococcoidales bacterium]|jgi:hypothetical protein|nr:hypothetical protein [Dehalococcoidales bacterium]
MEGVDPKEWALFQAKQELYQQYNEKLVCEVLANMAKPDWQTETHYDKGEKGVDIIAEKDNVVVVIEAKGERENTSQTSGESRIMAALGQIIMRMGNEEPDKKYHYCVAFPDTKAFTKSKIPLKPRKLLGITVLYVDCPNNAVKIVYPEAVHAQALNTFDGIVHIY